MSPMFLLLVYCVLILVASIAGGLIPLLVRLTHRRLQLAISLVAGVMLGVGLLHMLPHALMEAPDQPEVIFACVLAGFLTMFFIERFFCFHHHDVPSVDGAHGSGAHLRDAEPNQHTHDHAQKCAPSPTEDIDHRAHKLSWVGASIGLTLHTIIAGMALAASVAAESRGEHVTAVAGFGTFLVIFLHKPFDAMTITTLMTVGAWKKSRTHIVNGIFALMVPVGVGLFYFGLSHAGEGMNLVAYALAFSAGTFLCVSMSDLLPELQFHAHDRVALSASLLVGLSIAGGVGVLESQNHNHEGHGHTVATVDHGDNDHRAAHPNEHPSAGSHATHEHGAQEKHHDHAEEPGEHALTDSQTHDDTDAHRAHAKEPAADSQADTQGDGPHAHNEHDHAATDARAQNRATPQHAQAL